MSYLYAVNQPNVVSIAEIIETKEHVGVIMDWREGESRQDNLRRTQKVEMEVALQWTSQL